MRRNRSGHRPVPELTKDELDLLRRIAVGDSDFDPLTDDRYTDACRGIVRKRCAYLDSVNNFHVGPLGRKALQQYQNV